jgi:hypothetical protein
MVATRGQGRVHRNQEQAAELEVVAAGLRGAQGGRMAVAMELPRASMAAVAMGELQ